MLHELLLPIPRVGQVVLLVEGAIGIPVDLAGSGN